MALLRSCTPVLAAALFVIIAPFCSTLVLAQAAAAPAPSTAAAAPSSPRTPAAAPVATAAPALTVPEPAKVPAVSPPDLALEVAKLRLEVEALRQGMERERLDAQVREQRARQHAAWVSRMEEKRADLRVGRLAAIVTGMAILTAGLAVHMVKSDYKTGPIIGTALSGALATGAAIKLAKVVHQRQAITQEIRAHAPD